MREKSINCRLKRLGTIGTRCSGKTAALELNGAAVFDQCVVRALMEAAVMENHLARDGLEALSCDVLIEKLFLCVLVLSTLFLMRGSISPFPLLLLTSHGSFCHRN